jgi:hypothetical protein
MYRIARGTRAIRSVLSVGWTGTWDLSVRRGRTRFRCTRGKLGRIGSHSDGYHGHHGPCSTTGADPLHISLGSCDPATHGDLTVGRWGPPSAGTVRSRCQRTCRSPRARAIMRQGHFSTSGCAHNAPAPAVIWRQAKHVFASCTATAFASAPEPATGLTPRSTTSRRPRAWPHHPPGRPHRRPASCDCSSSRASAPAER